MFAVFGRDRRADFVIEVFDLTGALHHDPLRYVVPTALVIVWDDTRAAGRVRRRPGLRSELLPGCKLGSTTAPAWQARNVAATAIAAATSSARTEAAPRAAVAQRRLLGGLRPLVCFSSRGCSRTAPKFPLQADLFADCGELSEGKYGRNRSAERGCPGRQVAQVHVTPEPAAGYGHGEQDPEDEHHRRRRDRSECSGSG